jgi:hypothetical protein
MPDTTNISELRLRIIHNIREGLLDVTYEDEMSDAELAGIVEQMGIIAEYVYDMLGVEVQRENEDGSISALLHMKEQ